LFIVTVKLPEDVTGELATPKMEGMANPTEVTVPGLVEGVAHVPSPLRNPEEFIVPALSAVNGIVFGP
jgi:hypothetical protein